MLRSHARVLRNVNVLHKTFSKRFRELALEMLLNFGNIQFLNVQLYTSVVSPEGSFTESGVYFLSPKAPDLTILTTSAAFIIRLIRS